MKKRAISFVLAFILCLMLAAPLGVSATSPGPVAAVGALQQSISTLQLDQEFSITIGASTPGILARRRDVTVEALSTADLDGKFLVVQVSTPGAGRFPTVSAIRLQDSRREVVTISYTNPNSVIDIKLVENAARFIDPMMVLYAFANTR